VGNDQNSNSNWIFTAGKDQKSNSIGSLNWVRTFKETVPSVGVLHFGSSFPLGPNSQKGTFLILTLHRQKAMSMERHGYNNHGTQVGGSGLLTGFPPCNNPSPESTGSLAPFLPPSLPPIGAEPIGLCTIKSGEKFITSSATLIAMEEPGQIRKSFSVATYEWA
jgi:hypothetical protein